MWKIYNDVFNRSEKSDWEEDNNVITKRKNKSKRTIM